MDCFQTADPGLLTSWSVCVLIIRIFEMRLPFGEPGLLEGRTAAIVASYWAPRSWRCGGRSVGAEAELRVPRGRLR